MALIAGTRLGPYEIISAIGAGGMGEVYRAHDSSLGRDVAIKVLPAGWLDDPERGARFQREARVLASLNHSNIGTIYGLTDSDGMRGLVLELIEGPTLAERIARRGGPGPAAARPSALSVDEAVRIARQIADALEAAHEAGIVHRDLKPANIKITPNGVVKVLDFGLAKVDGDERGMDSDAPTRAVAETRAGLVMGTPSYMSPEQARGKSVDKRTDIWAFGCVLYEMLTGRQAFGGETTSDVIVSILERDPDWAALPPETPAGVRRLLFRCLTKDAKRRLHDIADGHFDLDERTDGQGDASSEPSLGVAPPEPASAVPAGRGRLVALVAGIVLLAGAVWWFYPKVAEVLPAPSVTTLTAYPGSESAPSFSPDGRQVAFTWNGGEGLATHIYVQQIGSDAPSQLTTGPASDMSPAWSPSGDQIAFLRATDGHDALYLVSQRGDSERKLADLQPAPASNAVLFMNLLLSWSHDGRWLAVGGLRSGEDNGIMVFAADGSSRRMLLPAAAPIVSYTAPSFSPHGDAVAFSACQGAFQCFVEVADLTSTLTLSGPPRRLSQEPEVVAGMAWSENGQSLIYGAASVWLNTFHLWRVPVSGARPPERLELAGLGALPAVSSAAHRLAYSRRNFDLNIWQVEDGKAPIPILATTLADYEGYFSHDGKKIAFITDRADNGSEVWTANRDGSQLLSLTKGRERTLGSPRWSPDDTMLAFDGKGDDGPWHVSVIDAAGGQPRQLTHGTFSDSIPSWSHDGTWVYFGSSRTGRSEVWRVRATGGDVEQVTQVGGSSPLESPDGKTLYYLRARALYSRPVGGGPERKVLDAVNAWQYMPVEKGVYYVPPAAPATPSEYEVRFLDFASGKSRVLSQIRAQYFGNGLSASPDGKVLVNGVTSIDSDLMVIENHR